MGLFSKILIVAVIFSTVPNASSADDLVEWGRYLAIEVGKCLECHTPKLPDGKLDKSKWFKGAEVEVTPINPIPNWHKTSPDLTPSGRLWKRWGEENLKKYLITGLTPNGKPAGPPMPTYTLKPRDAEAIVEFLKSFK